jgi:hypothetical protein
MIFLSPAFSPAARELSHPDKIFHSIWFTRIQIHIRMTEQHVHRRCHRTIHRGNTNEIKPY